MPIKGKGWTSAKRRKAGKKAKATYKKKIGAARMAKRTKIAHRIAKEKAAGRIKGPREPYAIATEAIKPGGAKRMARKAVRTKGPTGLKRAARKAVATKGKIGLRKAAKKAARTRRLGKRKSRKIIGSAYKFAGNLGRSRYPGYGRTEQIRRGAGGMRGLIRRKITEL